LKVESSIGRGTRLIASLPRQDQPETPLPESAAA
jgi:hypothetical protein